MGLLWYVTRGKKAEVAATEFPVTFADGKRKSSRRKLYVQESEEEKWRIGLHENTSALCTNGVSNPWLERRRFVSHSGDIVSLRNVTLFILPWRDTVAMSNIVIRRNYASIFVYWSILNFYSPDIRLH